MKIAIYCLLVLGLSFILNATFPLEIGPSIQRGIGCVLLAAGIAQFYRKPDGK